jgi:hypothetical protein
MPYLAAVGSPFNVHNTSEDAPCFLGTIPAQGQHQMTMNPQLRFELRITTDDDCLLQVDDQKFNHLYVTVAGASLPECRRVAL